MNIVIIISILIFTILTIFMAVIVIMAEIEEIERISQQAKSIVSFLEKKIYTFAELRDGLSELASFTYLDVFEMNFKLSSVDEKTELIITLYYSQKEIEEKLYNSFINKSSDIGKIGSLKLKK